MQSPHFDSKEAISHVVEKQAQGIVNAHEVHGTEIPGHLSSAMDSAKETAVLLAFAYILGMSHIIPLFLAIVVWKTGRSAILGYSRLERLHRTITQEKWEIEHHRAQEREELKALYEAKGFHGKLLDDVVDVLMADGDRLLKVMVEEELGLSLETQQHPLKQAFGAFLGAFIGGLAVIFGFMFFQEGGALLATAIIVALSSFLAARYEKNDGVHAVIWNLGISLLALATAYFIGKR